jgi:hypothetical protein
MSEHVVLMQAMRYRYNTRRNVFSDWTGSFKAGRISLAIR